MRNFLMNLNYKLNRLMAGRYGVDKLSKDLLIVAIVFWLLSSIFRMPLFSLLSSALLIWIFFRTYSKNISNRRAELQKYLNITQKSRNRAKRNREFRQMRKTHRLYKCKNCKTILRVPKGVGKIKITCAKCQTTMIKKA